jgi:fido (protein-threonine AMPylation protein)
VDFLRRVTSLLVDLNIIHSFRPGNGRAQLSDFFPLAQEAGHPLDTDRPTRRQCSIQ